MKFLRDWWAQRVKLSPGTIEFTVGSREEGKSDVWRSDLIVLKILAEELEAKHNLLKQSDGTLAATSEFFAELAGKYVDQGCKTCTPAMAWEIWIVVDKRFRLFDRDFKKQLQKAIW